MNIKIKTALILLVTFTLGIVLGVVGSNTLMRRYHPPFMAGGINSEMFVNRAERILELTDDQKQKVAPILNAYAAKMVALNDAHRDEFRTLMDSLTIELSHLLPSEQLQKLEARRAYFRNVRPHPNDKTP